jgi:hypothetical protein
MKLAEVKQAKSRILYDKVFWGLTTVKTVPDAGCWMHQNDTGYWIPDGFIEHRVSKIQDRSPWPGNLFFAQKGREDEYPSKSNGRKRR